MTNAREPFSICFTVLIRGLPLPLLSLECWPDQISHAPTTRGKPPLMSFVNIKVGDHVISDRVSSLRAKGQGGAFKEAANAWGNHSEH